MIEVSLFNLAQATREAAWEAVRHSLAAKLNCRPEELPVERTAAGKPYLRGGDLHFSLSRRGHWCALALSHEAPVGIDLELIRPVPQMDKVAAHFFPPVLQAEWVRCPDCFQCFYRHWTRLEATLKAAGLTLDAAPAQVPSLPAEHHTRGHLQLCVAAEVQEPLVVEWPASAIRPAGFPTDRCADAG